eukprot:3611655-Amphidinium_carterae.1
MERTPDSGSTGVPLAWLHTRCSRLYSPCSSAQSSWALAIQPATMQPGARFDLKVAPEGISSLAMKQNYCLELERESASLRTH